MKALRYIGGVLLATLGVLWTLVPLTFFFGPTPKTLVWTDAVIFVVLGLPTLGAGYALLRATLNAPCRPCPQCGSGERQPAVVLRKFFNPWRFVILNFLILEGLWVVSRDVKVRCTQCETRYMTDTRTIRIVRIVFWAFVLTCIGGLTVQILDPQL